MLLSLKDQLIQGMRQSLKTDTPGNFTVKTEYLSITVVSLCRSDVDNFKLDAGRSSFIIPDLNQNGKMKNNCDTVFLEVQAKVVFVFLSLIKSF